MRVVLEPGNPFDLTEDDLGKLKQDVEAAEASASVRVYKRDERGYGVTLIEVINVFIAAGEVVGAGYGLGQAGKAVIDFMKNRWNRDKTDHPGQSPRPRSIRFYDEEGNLLRTINIDEPDGDPTEKDDDGGDLRHRDPPPPERV